MTYARDAMLTQGSTLMHARPAYRGSAFRGSSKAGATIPLRHEIASAVRRTALRFPSERVGSGVFDPFVSQT